MVRTIRNKNKGEQNTFSRRRFLALSIATAAAGAVYLAYKFGIKDEEWEFLSTEDPSYLSERLKTMDTDLIRKTYVPICDISKYVPNDPEFVTLREEIIPKILEEGARRGLKGNLDTLVTYQDYGIPESNSKRAESAREYLIKATEFMYNHPELDILKKEDFDWVVIRPGDNFTNSHNRKGYVGLASCRIQQITSRLTGSTQEPIIFERALLKNYCSLERRRNNDEKLMERHVFCSTSRPEYVLRAAFSEIIPLLVDEQTHQFDLKKGYLLARKAIEAVSESISTLLALEFAEKMQVPNSKEILEGSLPSESNEVYEFVEKATNWTRRHGIKRAIELYIEDPGKYLEEVIKQ